MRAIKLSLIFAVLLICAKTTIAQDNSKIQATFIYNFTRLVSWPASYQSGDFVIGVLGNTTLLSELKTLSQSKKAGNQTIVVKQFSDIASIEKCHILIVPSSQSKRIAEVSSLVKSKGFATLVVSDNANGIKNGSMVNFVVKEDRQRFELSESKAKDAGLSLGTEILRLAIVIK